MTGLMINIRMTHRMFIIGLVLSWFIGFAWGAENVHNPRKKTTPRSKPHSRAEEVTAACEAGTAAADLDINNVRARIMNVGDMWWDLVGNPRYEIPKQNDPTKPKKHSLFAGSIWLGGLDAGGNLRVAAMTYRQDGSDYWPGPLDSVTISTNDEVCFAYDRIWKINRSEIDEFLATGNPSAAITDWPAHPIVSGYNHSYYLAPFVDVDGDGTYNPYAGDYPDILGDQTLWFIYNDKGNVHSETGGDPIGIEIQTMAFGFATTGDINNMTFYKHKITNRATTVLEETYLGQWVDPDLGKYDDDFVGCDTTRGLGICYNGDDNDEGPSGYGANPPAVGVDFFEGPLADPNDGIDNDKDGIIDEPGEKIIMSKFVYYNNDFSDMGNPEDAQHFYNYLRGIWKNGDCIKYGGDGFSSNGPCTNYMFPSDPRDPAGWSEVTAGNQPADRRFLQSAGPFTLQPGAVNYTVVGVVWARASSGGNIGSWDLLLLADDRAQRLYDNNFQMLEGPAAPDVVITELDRELILTLVNTKETESFYAAGINTYGDSVHYRFEGYQIYQLRNSEVTTADLDDPEKARLIAVVDVKNGITTVVNKEYNPELGAKVPRLMVRGEDKGIRHTFRIVSDAFAPGNDILVNHWPYYFTVLAYSVAEEATEDRRYLAGRKNVRVYMGMPHRPEGEGKGGQITQASYGSQPAVTRIGGAGNGGKILQLTEGSILEAIQNGIARNAVYEKDAGPLNVYVFDPKKVPIGDFEFRLVDTMINSQSSYVEPSDKARAELINLTTNEVIPFDTTYIAGSEQVFEKWGLAIHLERLSPPMPGDKDAIGVLASSITFADPEAPWLTRIPDVDFDPRVSNAPPYPMNWIRSGDVEIQGGGLGLNDFTVAPESPVDADQVFEKLAGGIIAPYAMCARNVEHQGAKTLGPVYGGLTSVKLTPLEWLHSVEIVLTPDKTKWTKCLVVEMGEDPTLTEGGAKKFQLRKHASWSDPNAVDADGKPIYDNTSEGYSWFPGYAINLETGERLPIIFGEDSRLVSENGNDMIWNPTSLLQVEGGNYYDDLKYPWGGRHVVYIMYNHKVRFSGGQLRIGDRFTSLDEALAHYASVLEKDPDASSVSYKFMWPGAAYVMMPLLQSGFQLKSLKEGLIPNEVRIRVNVRRPYVTFQPTDGDDGTIVYRFSTRDLAAMVNDSGQANALELINVVPNPYYGWSRYETGQLDNRVRFTNLPGKFKIRIYTLNGTLVRTIQRDAGDDAPTYVDWDLKNENGTPIGSGLYIIHVDAYDLGEKTLKWVGILRPVDLDAF